MLFCFIPFLFLFENIFVHRVIHSVNGICCECWMKMYLFFVFRAKKGLLWPSIRVCYLYECVSMWKANKMKNYSFAKKAKNYTNFNSNNFSLFVGINSNTWQKCNDAKNNIHPTTAYTTHTSVKKKNQRRESGNLINKNQSKHIRTI